MTAAHALIVDDDANNLAILGELLAAEGVTSTRVQNPRTLPAVLQTLSRLDVVFLDLEMPGLNGYQVLAQLHNHPLSQRVPVVAYTVHVSEFTHARQVGFHSFLGKPLDADRFPEQLARILRGERVWALQ